MYYRATIEVLVDVEDEASACDAISEAIRPMLREFYEGENETNWIDWRYANHGDPAPHSGKGFEYAEERGEGHN